MADWLCQTLPRPHHSPAVLAVLPSAWHTPCPPCLTGFVPAVPSLLPRTFSPSCLRAACSHPQISTQMCPPQSSLLDVFQRGPHVFSSPSWFLPLLLRSSTVTMGDVHRLIQSPRVQQPVLSSPLFLQDPTHALPTGRTQQIFAQRAKFSGAQRGSERSSELLRVTQLAPRSLSKAPPHMQLPPPPFNWPEWTHLQATDAGRAGIRLEHDLDVLEHLVASRPGPGHLIGHLLGSFLQLERRRGAGCE